MDCRTAAILLLLLLVLAESRYNHTRVKREDIPRNHICNTRNPCRFIGYCRPVKDSKGQVTSKYRCECYKQYYTQKECRGDYSNSPKLVNHCRDYLCENGGTCVSVWGAFFCKCRDGFHGVYCEERMRGRKFKRTSTPQVLFNPEVYTARYFYIAVVFENQSVGEDFSMEIETGDGLEFLIYEHMLLVASPNQLQRFIESKRLKGILASSNKPDEGTTVYIYRHEYAAKNVDLEIAVVIGNAMLTQFIGYYPIRVVKRPADCIPNVELLDCWKLPTKRPKYRRRFSNIFRSVTEQDCAPFKSTLSHEWLLYNISRWRPFPEKDPLRRNQLNFFKYNYPQKIPAQLIIYPFTFSYGHYVVEVISKETVPRNYYWKTSHRNMARCWFDIFPIPLSIIMVGGEARSVGKDQDLKVDASGCHDPNEADDNQGHLVFKWTCSVKNPSSTEFCKGNNKVVSSEKILIVPKKHLVIGQEYKFNLELSSKIVHSVPAFTSKPVEMVQTVTVVKGNPPKLDIECLMNCGKSFKPNPRDVVSMKVVCKEFCQGESEEKFYEWDIKSSKSDENINWDKDTQTGRHTYRLIVRENVLSAGTTYDFKVTGGTDTKTSISLAMTINMVPEIGDCSIEPDTGYSGITEFGIKCKDVQDEDEWPLRYDFFQSNDEDFIGVLIYYNVEPNATGVKLMEGKSDDDYKSAINVKVTDNFGMFAEARVPVTVKPMQQAVGEEDLLDSVKFLVESNSESGTLPSLLSGGDMSGAVRLIGSLADALVNIESPEETPNLKSDMTSGLLSALEQVPVPTIAAVTQVASVLRKVMTTDEKALEPNSAVTAATMTLSLSNQLLERIDEDVKATEEVRQVAKSVIDCVSTVIATFPTGRQSEDYSDINREEVETQGNVQVASDQALETIEKIGEALGRQIVERQDAITVVAEKVSLWVKEDKPSALAGHMMGVGKTDKYGVKLTSDLAASLEENSTYLQFQISIIEENPFWWQKVGNDINSDVTSVSVQERKKKQEAKELPKPIDIYLRVKSLDEIPIVNGSMNLTLDPEKIDEFENNIPIHRIDLKEGETVFVSFEPFEKSDIVMKALITQGYRPEMEDFDTLGTSLPRNTTQSDEQYLVTIDEKAVEDDAWFYVGLIPDNKTRKNISKTEEFFVMDYQFRVHTTRCQYWSLKDKEWSTEGCTIGPETSSSKIHCRCSHLSAFSGSLLVPPNRVNPIYDVNLFLTVIDNPLVVVFVCLFLLCALLLMVWARRQDKKDILRRRVTILEDNTPGEYYGYMVTVYTGSRKGAGTTSTVGIQLIGSRFSSKCHILRSSKRKVLKTAYADWFVIFTDSSLGDLMAINLWHNSSGHRQSWFCRDIVVRDIQTKEKWTFLLNRWISLLHGNGTASYTIPAATKKQEKSFGVLLADNNDFRFRDDHLFLSIFARNPRSFFTRVQRIAAITNITFMAMLGNIMFYGVPKGTPADQMDQGSFSVDMRPIMIGLETSLITVPISFLIVYLFRKISPKPTPLLRKSIIEVLHPERDDNSVSGGEDQSDSKYTERPSILEDIKRKWGLSRFRANLLYILPTDPVTETDYLDYTAYVSEQTESKKSKKCSCFAWCKKRKTQESDAVGASNPRYSSFSNTKNASNVGSSQKHKVGPPYLFPWWVIYIAWFLTVTSTVFAAYFVMLYGLSYGRVKSYLWLTAMVSSIVTKVFIIEPIKILCISLLFTIIFKIEAKEVDMQTGAPLEIELPRNYRLEVSEEHLMKLIQKRQEREYKPIPEQWLGFLRVRARKRRQLGFMMYDLMIFLLYMIILCCGATYQRDSLTFQSSKNVANMFIEAKYWGSTKFQDINNNVRVRARKRRQLGFMMYDLMIFLLYMIILCCGATYQRDSLTFQSSKNVANMFIEAKYWGSTKFQDINNNVSLVHFLNHTLIPSLHEVAWYNGNETEEEGWTADLSTKLLGVARLRQLRVRNDSCYPSDRINKLFKHCWAPFSNSAQDTQNYAIKWKRPNKIEYSSRAKNPWMYQSSYDSDSWPIIGEFAFYPGGGYISNLGKTRENSKKVLQFLVDYGWLDSLTRAVIVEFTLYNANRNLFNVVTLLIEVDAAGTCATFHNKSVEFFPRNIQELFSGLGGQVDRVWRELMNSILARDSPGTLNSYSGRNCLSNGQLPESGYQELLSLLISNGNPPLYVPSLVEIAGLPTVAIILNPGIPHWGLSDPAIKTASLLYIHSTNYRVQLVLFVLFIVMVSVLFLRQMMIMRELSVRVFCSKFWNLLDVFIVFVGTVCIAIIFTRNFHVRSLLKRLAVTDDNEFISFYDACFIDEILSYTIGFLICLSTVRLWRLLHFGQNFQLFEVTLFLARHSLLSLALMFVLILVGFACLVYLVMGNVLRGFHGLSRCFSMLLSLSLDLNKDFEYSVFFESNRVLGPIIFLSFCIVCAIFAMNMFVTVMLTYYTAAQEHIFRNKTTYNLYHYMRDEFYHYFRKSTAQGRTDTIRLRGGADKDDLSEDYHSPRSSEHYHSARSTLDEDPKNIDRQTKKSSRSSVGSKKSNKSLERRSSASLDRKGSSARSVGRKKSLKQVNSKGKKPKSGSKTQLEDTEDTAAPPIKKTLGRKKSSARSLKPSRSSQKDDSKRGQKRSRSKSRAPSAKSYSKKNVTINDDKLGRNLLEADEIDPTEHKVIQTDDIGVQGETPSTRWLEPDELTVRTGLVLDVYPPEDKRPRPPEKDKKTQTDRDQRTQTQRDKRTQTQRDKRTQTLKDNVTQTPRESWTQGPVDCLKPPPPVDKITQYPGLTPGQPCVIDAASSALSLTGEEYCPVFENKERVRFKEPTASIGIGTCECGTDTGPICRCDEFYKIPPVRPLRQRSERARDSGTQTVCECHPGKPTSSGDEKTTTPSKPVSSTDRLTLCGCGSPKGATKQIPSKDTIPGDQNRSPTATICMCGGATPGDQKKVSMKPVPSHRNAVPLCKCGPSDGISSDQKKEPGLASKDTTLCKCGPSSGDQKKASTKPSPPPTGVPLCKCAFENPTFTVEDPNKLTTIPPYRNAVPLCKCRAIPGSPPGDQKKAVDQKKTQDTSSFCKCGASHPGNAKKVTMKEESSNKGIKETLPLCKCGTSSGDGKKGTTKPVESKDTSQDVKGKKTLLDRWWPFNRSSKLVICNNDACEKFRIGKRLKPADNPEVGKVEKNNKRDTIGPFNNSRTLMVTSKSEKANKWGDNDAWTNKPCVPVSETDSKDSLASGYKLATAPSSAVKVCVQNPMKNRVVHEQCIPRQCSKCKNTYIQSRVGVRKTPSRCSPM